MERVVHGLLSSIFGLCWRWDMADRQGEEMVVTLILLIGCIAIYASSGYLKYVSDTLTHHFIGSEFEKKKDQQWWDLSLSWKNKYRNGKKEDGPRFFGSTTFLVFTTDAWHLYDMLYMTALQLPFCIMTVHLFVVSFQASAVCYVLILPLLGLVKLAHGVVFEKYYE